MEIREIKKSDLPMLAKLDSSIFKDCEEIHSLKMFEHGYKIRIKEASLAIIENNVLIGAIFVEKRHSFSSPNSAFVTSFFLTESNTGKGFGSKLMSASIDALKKKGFTHITLLVHPENKRGIKFYEKFGFTLSRLNYSKEL